MKTRKFCFVSAKNADLQTAIIEAFNLVIELARCNGGDIEASPPTITQVMVPSKIVGVINVEYFVILTCYSHRVIKNQQNEDIKLGAYIFLAPMQAAPVVPMGQA